MDVASLKSNVSAGNVGGAIVDGLGLALDVGATLLPGIPGGAGIYAGGIQSVYSAFGEKTALHQSDSFRKRLRA